MMHFEEKNGCNFLIREAVVEDAHSLLDYIGCISGESDFLSFNPGEFELHKADEENVLRKYHDSDNQFYILGLIDRTIAAALCFSGGHRLRVRTDNQRAIGLYKHKGFMIEGTIRREIFIDGEYFDHHWTGLEL